MLLHTNDPGRLNRVDTISVPLVDLNQSCSTQQSFERADGNRFPHISCSFDDSGCSRNRHDTLYSTDTQPEPAGMLLDQGKTGLPGSNGDSLGVADQHKYYRETFHRMRHPAVDPRKSRRHGTDFGLGRYMESSLTVLNSDHQNTTTSVSAPLITMQDNMATDGDSVFSLFECSALDFPQPPPIGNSVIRQMCSSPWFSDDKGCLNKGFSHQESQRSRRSASVLLDSDVGGPCYSVASVVTQLPTMRRDNLRSGRHGPSDVVDGTANAERAGLHLSPYFDLGINDISLEMVGEALIGLDMNASSPVPQKLFLDNSAYGVPSCEFFQASGSDRQFVKSSHVDWSTPSDLLRWSASHRSLPIMSAPMPQQRICGGDTLQDEYEYHAFRTKTKPLFSLPSGGIHSLGRLPRIIRKIASMRSDARRPEDTNCVPPGSTGPKIIPKSCSFRSIPLVACEAGNSASNTIIDGGPHQHSNWSFTNLDYISSKDGQNLRCQFSSPTLNDSLRSFDHCAEHMSVPSSGLGRLGSEAAQHKAKATALPMALSSPFVHRGTCHRPLAEAENDLPNGTEKSFINITPIQGTMHQRSAAATKRARVKKMIARASNGIIGWGRQLTRKNSYVG